MMELQTFIGNFQNVDIYSLLYFLLSDLNILDIILF